MDQKFELHHFEADAFEQYEKRLYQKIQNLIAALEPQLDRQGQITLAELTLTYFEAIKLISMNSFAQGLKSKLN